ncbi:hypothetical protein J4Q44_G00067890 [Coregonus suidteri]|uniref:Uncharacterized protein n=1 Tax=Coregonus suidteri TaxID=861788 RepID=A0AAN8RCH2_9TELE
MEGTRRGSAAYRRVPEERSAALQDVSRMGANNAAREPIHVREIFTSYFFEEGYISCVGETLAHLNWLTQRAQHDQRGQGDGWTGHRDGRRTIQY